MSLPKPSRRRRIVGNLAALAVVGLFAWWMVWPAYLWMDGARQRGRTNDRLRALTLVVFTDHDYRGHYPPADGHLSWRAEVLPYLGEKELAARFDRGQPWDAPANRPLADVRVAAFTSPLDSDASAVTRVRVFTGPGTLFPPGKPPLRLGDITDGNSNTILAVEAAEAVPWSAPWELPYAAGAPLPPLGHPEWRDRRVYVIMADGTVRSLYRGVTEAALRAAITPAGGDGGLDSDRPPAPAAPPVWTFPPPPAPPERPTRPPDPPPAPPATVHPVRQPEPPAGPVRPPGVKSAPPPRPEPP